MPGTYCCVNGCSNGYYKLQRWAKEICTEHGCRHDQRACVCESPFTLFQFPKYYESKNIWIQKVNRKDEKGNMWCPGKTARVCSRHFIDGLPTTLNPHPTEHMGYTVQQNKILLTTDTFEMTEMAEENAEEKSDFNRIDSYSMNHMTSSSTDAHVSRDCHTEIKVKHESQDFTDLLTDNSLLQNIKQEYDSEETCSVDDTSSEQSLTTSEGSEMSDNEEIEEESEKKREICHQCNKSYSSAKNLILHIKQMHGSDVLHHCTLCEKSFKSKFHLAQHIKRMHGEKKHKCESCDYRTSCSDELKLHQDSIHVKLKPEICPRCDYHCLDKSELSLHINSVHYEPCICSVCDARFSTLAALNMHCRRVHSDYTPFQCNLCYLKCTLKSTLREHVRNDHGVVIVGNEGVYDYHCAGCDLKFSSESDASKHWRAEHIFKKIHECTECNNTFTELGNLKRHISAVHEGLRPYTCTECGKGFSAAAGLRRHINSVHKKLKRFAYTKCEEKFGNANVLQRHLQTKHQISDMEITKIKEENDEEKSDFNMIDSYSMNHMTSSSTDAHVSGDCHTKIKVKNESQDFTDQLTEESQSQKTCSMDDASSEESLTSQDTDEMAEIKEENNEEKSDFKIIDSYSMNHMTSSSTDAHVSRDCHSEIKVETQDCCSEAFHLLSQESQLLKTCAVDDSNSDQSLTSQDVRCVSSRKVTAESCSTSDNNRCPVCNKSFVTFDSLKQHVQQEHVDERQHDCTDGSSIISSSENMEQESEENNKKREKCRHCCKDFSSLSYLRQHEHLVHGESLLYRCSKCDKSFNSRNKLSCHFNLVHGEKKYKCISCDYRTGSSLDLTKHRDSAHMILKPDKLLSCSHCDYRCSGRSQLIKHMNTIHYQIETFNCLVCNMIFSTITSLVRHCGAVRCGYQPYHCQLCEYKSAQKINLQVHIEKVHGDVEKFPCKQCERKFTSKNDAREHWRAEHFRIHKCYDCNKTYTTKQSLQRHLAAVHEGLKPHTCTECDMNFSDNSSLQTHIYSVHKKLKRFKCTRCDKKFHFAYRLRHHMSSKHKASELEASVNVATSDWNDIMGTYKKHVRQP